jgi:hypothetical protein
MTTNLALASIKATSAIGATTAALGDRFSRVLNVKLDFGALGTGSGNDGPAIQNALNALKTTGTARALYFPPGTYNVTQVLYITNTTGVRIFGDGTISTVIQYRGSATLGNTEASGAGAVITPVIMTNGFSYSSMSGLRLNSIAGTNTCGIYFYQDDTHSKGNTDQLNISDMLVDGGCATGYLIGYPAQQLCSEIMFSNCVVNSCTGYGFRNYAANSLNNNLYNCGGVGNAVWCNVVGGSMNVYGASLAQNTIDIQPGQSPMAIIGGRTESFAFVDASAGQCFVTVIGCSQIPRDAVTAAYFINVANSTMATLIGNYIGSNASNQGKLSGGNAQLSLFGNYMPNATPFSGLTSGALIQQLGGPYTTVATLPAASVNLKGLRLSVTDATVAASTANFSSTVTGGGSNTVPVWCDGAAWRIG